MAPKGMISLNLKRLIEDALQAGYGNGMAADLLTGVEVVIETPRSPEHGDYSCGIGLKLAKRLGLSPMQIAQSLSERIGAAEEARDLVESLSVVAPGYLNFSLTKRCLSGALQKVHQLQEHYGADRNLDDAQLHEKILIEYVSANPTGELHIGHGRGAVYGSCLANLFKFVGYDVVQEFYINDTGEQILQFGRCIWALYQQHFGRSAPYPDEGYPQFLLQDFVDQVIAAKGDQFLALTGDEACLAVGKEAASVIVWHQRELLSRLRVNFDVWFSELGLHESGKVEAALALFAKRGSTYEKDGALWLKADAIATETEEGDVSEQRDRVLRKSSGSTTYLTNDAAYHLDKFERGFTHLINIWGADHHGQVPGLKAAIAALGRESSALEVILTQIVNLSYGGKLVRMSKRAGTVVLLSEVMDEVGVDAVRYYLAEAGPQNPISFDLELAKKTSRENPAFYIQYAHARCCSILRKSKESLASESAAGAAPAVISDQEWGNYRALYKNDSQVFMPGFDSDPEIFAHQKKLIMKIESFGLEVRQAVEKRLPGRIARYAYELANDFQKFYEVSRVISEDPAVTRARLGFVEATRQVLNNALTIIGVSAPESM